MTNSILLHLFRRARRSALTILSGTALALALMTPTGAIPAQKGANLLRHAVLAAPKLSPMMGHHDAYWHTDHNRILDARNREVRIGGVNWSGFETRRGVPGGLTLQDYRSILRTIKVQGYNTVRLPLSNEMIESPQIPQDVSYTTEEGKRINTDLEDLNSMQILDRIIKAAGKLSLRVILDDHRSEAGDSAQASGLWYTADFPEQNWVDDWSTLARRYKGNATVVGMDLRNEPHNAASGGACWDCGGDRDWHLAAERAGNAILRSNPKLLIFVEGVDAVDGDSYWWGGNLEGVRRSPVRLAVPNRLVYSTHVYGPAEYRQPWFNANTSRSSLRAVWRKHWAYISEAGLAPVWIGEFGTPNSDADVQDSEPGSEGQWFSELVQFIHEEHSLQWTYWGINGEDRYGLFDGQYRAALANAAKSGALASLLPGHLDLSVHTPATVVTAETLPTPRTGKQPVLPIIPVPTKDYAEVSRREVQQRLAPPQNHKLAEQGQTPGPALRPASPSSEEDVKRALDTQVQQAIAAAMHPN